MIASTHKPGQSGPVARAVMSIIRVQLLADREGMTSNFDRYWPVPSHMTIRTLNAHQDATKRDEMVKGRAAT